MSSTFRCRAMMWLLTSFVVLVNSAQADDGWSLNPFSKSKPKASSSTSQSAEKGSWMPDWEMPKMKAPNWMKSPFSKKKTTAKKKPSALSKMSKTTKNWWKKTTELLDPYPDEDPIPRETSSFVEKDTKPKGSWMSGLWGSKKKEPEYETVNDFLGAPTPY